VVLALVLGLVLTEACLQLASWALGRGDQRGAVERGAGLWVLCHGDSNVYGVYEDARDSYPAQLQTLLNVGSEDAPHRVRNLGLPGLNSRQLVRSLEGLLPEELPDALLVTIGANNEWSWTPSAGVARSEPPWYESLRLVKLGRIAAARLRDDEGRARSEDDGSLRVEVEGNGKNRIGHMVDREGTAISTFSGQRITTLDLSEQRRVLTEDLAELAALCSANEVPLFVVGYGSDRGKYGESNAILREATGELGIPLVDVVPALQALVQQRGFEQVHYLDLHPRAIGYARIAEQVLGALVDAGIHTGERATLDLDALAARTSRETSLRLSGRLDALAGSADELALELTDETPGRAVTIVLWGVARGDGDAPELARQGPESYVDLLDDPLFRRTLTDRELTGRIDTAGALRVPLTPLLSGSSVDALAGLRLRAAYILHGEGDETVFSRVSQAVTIELPSL